jgi:hypothetical protein
MKNLLQILFLSKILQSYFYWVLVFSLFWMLMLRVRHFEEPIQYSLNNQQQTDVNKDTG